MINRLWCTFCCIHCFPKKEVLSNPYETWKNENSFFTVYVTYKTKGIACFMSQVSKNDRELLKYRIERNVESPTGYYLLASQLGSEESATLADGSVLSKVDLLLHTVSRDCFFAPAWCLLASELHKRKTSGRPASARCVDGSVITFDDAVGRAISLCPEDDEVKCLLQQWDIFSSGSPLQFVNS